MDHHPTADLNEQKHILDDHEWEDPTIIVFRIAIHVIHVDFARPTLFDEEDPYVFRFLTHHFGMIALLLTIIDVILRWTVRVNKQITYQILSDT